MEMLGDDILIECIENSGYYEYQDVNLDDLSKLHKSAIILAGELLAMRPELNSRVSNIKPDEVYILEVITENGEKTHSLPTKDLSSLLRKKPFDDSSIWTYSVKDEKFIKRLYQGTGIKWEVVK